MPVSPMYGGVGAGNGAGFGGDWGWIILLLLIGWGNNGNGFGVGAGGRDGGSGNLYPWLNQSENVSNGFSSISNQICNGFAEVQQSISNGQMASMQQNFNSQTAITSGMNNIAMNLQNCCCENRANIADLKYTVATENCADRNQSMQNTRDIIDNQNRNSQAILDKLCQLELDGVKQNYENRIAGMQNVIDGLSAQVNAADRRVAMGEEVDALYNRLNNCPVPTTPVYGRTPIFTCNGQNGCSCSGNAFYN